MIMDNGLEYGCRQGNDKDFLERELRTANSKITNLTNGHVHYIYIQTKKLAKIQNYVNI